MHVYSACIFLTYILMSKTKADLRRSITKDRLSIDTVEKLDNLMRALIREDSSLAEFLYLPMNIDKYGLNG